MPLDGGQEPVGGELSEDHVRAPRGGREKPCDTRRVRIERRGDEVDGVSPEVFCTRTAVACPARRVAVHDSFWNPRRAGAVDDVEGLVTLNDAELGRCF